MADQERDWKSWLALTANAGGVLGVVILVATWFLRIIWPWTLIPYTIASMCFLYWIVGFVYVSGGRRLTSLGPLKSWQLSAEPKPIKQPPLRSSKPMTSRRLVSSVKTQPEIKLDVAEANIVFCRESADNYCRLEAQKNTNLVFREGDGPRSFYGLVATFRNEPKPPQRIGKATNVHATISYHDLDDPEEKEVVGVRIEEPYWVNESSSIVSFDLGQAQRLILGIFLPVNTDNKDYNLQVYDRRINDDVALATGSPIPFKIVTKLSWGEHREFGVETTFELRMRLDGRPYEKFFELFEVTGRLDENQQPIKISRGNATLR
jgi:hypothetical protein